MKTQQPQSASRSESKKRSQQPSVVGPENPSSGPPARAALTQARRVVVKVGSSLLTDGGKALDPRYLQKLASELSALRQQGLDVALVTSGAVAAGVSALGIERPKDIPRKQAAAAVGQSRLMHAYEEVFGPLQVKIAQVLVTHEDLSHRRRFLNARNTLTALFELSVLPIFNENDTVVVDEIKVGDNDNLSSLVATLIEADLLIILSDVAGLYDADPRQHPEAQRLAVVPRITAAVRRLAGGAGSSAGTGGMITKLQAAERAAAVGISTVIADGRLPGVLQAICAGQDVGTLFQPGQERLAARKHWIAFTLKASGRLLLDAGAVRAVVTQGKSLLPRGVLSVQGRFERGALVVLCDAEGQEFARGLIGYAADEVRKVIGKQSWQIEETLGYKYGDELVHRDDLCLLPAGEPEVKSESKQS